MPRLHTLSFLFGPIRSMHYAAAPFRRSRSAYRMECTTRQREPYPRSGDGIAAGAAIRSLKFSPFPVSGFRSPVSTKASLCHDSAKNPLGQVLILRDLS
jgi:hypothetical protein